MSTEVLVFGVNAVRGGVETYMYHFVTALKGQDFHFTFAGITDHPAFYQQLKALGSSFIQIPAPQRHPFAYAHAISDLLSRKHFDVVYENKFTNANPFPILCAKKAGIKRIIVHAHNTGFSGNLLEDILHILLKPLTSHLATDRWACSSLAAAHMFGKHASYVFVPNSIDVRKFEFSNRMRLTMRLHLGIQSDVTCIGHIGNFYRQKNHKRLIQIFARYHAINNKSVLLLVGSGSEKATLKLHQLCNKLGVASSVIFFGKSNHTADLYNAMDIFLLPSLFEGLSIVLIEAQANGLPCVVSSVVPVESNCHIETPYTRCNLKASDYQWVITIKQIMKYKTDRQKSGTQLENSIWDLSWFDRKVQLLISQKR